MGGYLDTPKTDKESEEYNGEQYSYGASSMQGWRISQEDAHNCCPDFDPKTNTSLFAVYDGHGGSEVAEYCAVHLPNFVKGTDLYGRGQLAEALEHSFLAFDEKLLEEHVIAEMKVLRGDENDTEEEDANEMDLLEEESDMPLEQLMMRYGGVKKVSTSVCQPSPALKPKVSPKNDDTKGSDPVKVDLVRELTNGHAQTETGVCGDCVNSNSEEKDGDTDSTGISKSHTAKRNGGCGEKESQNCEGENGTDCKASEHRCENNVPEQTKTNGGGLHGDKASMATGENFKEKSHCCNRDEETHNSESVPETSCNHDNGNDSSEYWNDSEDSDEYSDEEDMEGEEDEELDDEDIDEEEEEGQEEEEEEEGIVWHTLGDEDKPGSDSGCTAVVALLRGRDLYVANAGDSRCIVSRAGKSVEMSFDHKPEDEPERKRIENAGGEVTPDGRVNNGLNLSRAIGDHCYKRNDKLPLKDQMITALPDVKTMSLSEEDEFMVLACDGIWNFMTSQEVVDFISDKLSADTKLSTICEQMFDHCLAPDKTGDGTGCDNMTCIIVRFKDLKLSSTCKRVAEAEDLTEEDGESSNSAKKLKKDSVV